MRGKRRGRKREEKKKPTKVNRQRRRGTDTSNIQTD